MFVVNNVLPSSIQLSVTGAIPKLALGIFAMKVCQTLNTMARKTSLRSQSEVQAEGSVKEASVSPPPLPSHSNKLEDIDDEEGCASDSSHSDAIDDSGDDYGDSMKNDPVNFETYAGPILSEKRVKPLNPEALAAFNMTQARAGVIYISRIPPGMQPAKVRHLLSQYGEVGRVYLQQEGGIVGISPRCC